MSMPCEGAVADRLPDFQQSHGEHDGGHWLPKFRHFVVNQCSEQGGARKCKQASKQALIGIISELREPGSDIKHRRHYWQRDQPGGDVDMRCRLAVEIDNCDSIDSQCATHTVLHHKLKCLD